MYQIQLLTVTISVFLPILVGLVTRASWGGGVRAVVLIALTVVNGVLNEYLDFVNAANANAVFDWKAVGITAFVSFVGSVAAHFGVWKPTGTAEWAKGVMVKDRFDLAA